MVRWCSDRCRQSQRSREGINNWKTSEKQSKSRYYKCSEAENISRSQKWTGDIKDILFKIDTDEDKQTLYKTLLRRHWDLYQELMFGTLSFRQLWDHYLRLSFPHQQYSCLHRKAELQHNLWYNSFSKRIAFKNYTSILQELLWLETILSHSFC